LSKLRTTNPEKYTFAALLERFFAGWTAADREKAMRGIDESKLDEDKDEQQDEQQDEQKQDEQKQDEQKQGDEDAPTCSIDASHGRMVKKTARRGRNAGKSFWGCPRYPRCRSTRNMEGGA
jgi:ssDNA-binding Zn-finger/Zn-ribbon topoisomerase 1